MRTHVTHAVLGMVSAFVCFGIVLLVLHVSGATGLWAVLGPTAVLAVVAGGLGAHARMWSEAMAFPSGATIMVFAMLVVAALTDDDGDFRQTWWGPPLIGLIWSAEFLMVVGGAAVIAHVSHAARRREPWECGGCRYDLRGVRGSVCPECGRSQLDAEGADKGARG